MDFDIGQVQRRGTNITSEEQTAGLGGNSRAWSSRTQGTGKAIKVLINLLQSGWGVVPRGPCAARTPT